MRISITTCLLSVSIVHFVRSFQSISLTKDFQKSIHLNKSIKSGNASLLWAEKYGRGAEIYPPTNQIEFTLADSFPNGIVPPSAQQILDEFSSFGKIETEQTKSNQNETLNTASIISKDDSTSKKDSKNKP